jgi:hypothetical protein
MSDEYELLPVTQLRDLADQCGRRHWRRDKPIPASSYFVQRSRVENWRIVAGMIRDRSDELSDQRISMAVWASVCQAVDLHLGEPAMSLEKERTLAALAAGPAGKTELAARIGSMSDQQVIRRMKRLERLGRVERTGLEVMSAARRGETEWRVVGGGRV